MSSLERVELLVGAGNQISGRTRRGVVCQTAIDERTRGLAASQCYDRGARRPISPSPNGPVPPLSAGFVAAFQHSIAISALSPLPSLTVSGLENLSRAQRACPVRGQPHQPSRCPDDLHGVASQVAPASRSRNDEGPFPRLLRPLRTFVDRNSELRYWPISWLVRFTTHTRLPQQMPGTRAALAYTADLINRGYCPLVFPEGLRTERRKAAARSARESE